MTNALTCLGCMEVNYGVFTLVETGNVADSIRRYNPICLLNVCFNIFTKVLDLFI
jgi:hypothetical protein